MSVRITDYESTTDPRDPNRYALSTASATIIVDGETVGRIDRTERLEQYGDSRGLLKSRWVTTWRLYDTTHAPRPGYAQIEPIGVYTDEDELHSAVNAHWPPCTAPSEPADSQRVRGRIEW